MGDDRPAGDETIESARLAAVARYRGLLDDSDGVYGQIAALAARLFDAPMAKVTMVDRDHIHFVATHGFQSPDGRIPRGEGVCDLIVTGQMGHLVDDALADAMTSSRAFLRQLHVRFYACAPIVDSHGYRLGTVTVMDTAPRTASTEQLGMLEDLAAVVAKQLEIAVSSQDSIRTEQRIRGDAESARDDARLARDAARTDRDTAVRERESAERERDSVEAYASALQTTLLPPRLPVINGADIAAHFRPASPRQVSGDFYDVFPLGEDRWGFFIGDVTGHGVEAAVTTSLIRYTLRSAAWHYDDPEQVLTELNTVMMAELDPRRACTVITGTLRPEPHGAGSYITLGTGGHQPGLFIDPDGDTGTAHPVRPSTGMIVGAIHDASFSTCCLHLRPGQTLLLFTDGIIEARRGEDAFDIDSLAAFVHQRAHLSATELTQDLATLAAKLEPDDDVAVLAIQAAIRRD